jgi:hypothetical protein
MNLSKSKQIFLDYTHFIKENSIFFIYFSILFILFSLCFYIVYQQNEILLQQELLIQDKQIISFLKEFLSNQENFKEKIHTMTPDQKEVQLPLFESEEKERIPLL